MPTVISYPNDLGTTPSLQNFVTFYINVRAGAPTLTGPGGGPLGAEIPGAGGIVGRRLPAAPGGEIIAATARGAAALVRTVAPGAPGEVFGASVTRRLDTAIALHINTAPTAEYHAKYSDIDYGMFGNFSQTMAGNMSLKELAQVFGATLAKNMIQAHGNPFGEGVVNRAGAALKVRLNPYKQQYFEHMEFRNFDFQYNFFPKSAAEAESVRQIIRLFKFHMHPHVAAGGGFLIYPSEFDIVYNYGEAENGYLHKIATSVLTEVKVRYGSPEENIKYAAFPGGNPVEVQMQLKFKEIETLTKEAIEVGF